MITLDTLNEHVWKLADLVHPRAHQKDERGNPLPLTGWQWRIATRYNVEFESLDGALSYEWAMILWAGLALTEQQRVEKLHQQYSELPKEMQRELDKTVLQAR